MVWQGHWFKLQIRALDFELFLIGGRITEYIHMILELTKCSLR